MTSIPEEQDLQRRAHNGDYSAQQQLRRLEDDRTRAFMEAQEQQQRHWAAEPARPMLPRGCALYSILIVAAAFGVEWMMQTAMSGIALLLGEEAAGGPQRWMFETGRFLMPLLAIMLGGDWLFNHGLNGRNPLRLLATASLWLIGLTLVAGVLALAL